MSLHTRMPPPNESEHSQTGQDAVGEIAEGVLDTILDTAADAGDAALGLAGDVISGLASLLDGL